DFMTAAGATLAGNGKMTTPVFSPADPLSVDGKPDFFGPNRKNPPAGSGLKQASSEIFNVASIKSAGYPVVTWTVNTKARMLELIKLGVNGFFSSIARTSAF